MKKKSTKECLDYDLPLHRRFELQVERYPEHTALIFENLKLSYRELNARVNQLAHRLRALGVGPEKLVGVLLDRSVDLIIAILGVLKAGGAYVPLDPNYPEDRLAHMFADCAPEILITQQNLTAKVHSTDMHVCCLDLDLEIATQSTENPELNVTLSNLAYIIYTSGSTGKPKGCLTEHGNVMRLWAESEGIFSFNASDIWTLFHSYTFDFSVWEIWGPLLHGGTLVIVPFTVSRSPDAFYDLLVREKVTVLNQTPSAFFQLMRFEGTQPHKSLCLRYLILGGEALNFQAIKPWTSRYPLKKTQIINGYGPTETTIFATFKFINNEDIKRTQVSNLGSAIPHLSLHIVNNELTPVNPGDVGEILIGGHGVARGYLNRPDLTAKRFITHRISGKANARFYRTGDLARFMPDGQIEYLGRIDNQVKIRGFRIELGEIECVLRTHPAVREAAVTVREDSAGEPVLAAYIVPEPKATLPFKDMRKYLMASLPDYMVPVTLTQIDSLPLTPNGKLDRNALPQPESTRPDLEQPYIAPRSDLERKLAKLYGSLLQIDTVGIDDNFFELGGNSLSSIQLVENIKNELGLVLPVVKLFEHPSVCALANYLEPKAGLKTRSKSQAQIGSMQHATKKVAIIGMAGQYPGAANTTEFWKNLCDGIETTSFFSDAELDKSLSNALRNSANYVKARGILKDIEQFDAAFFGINPYEAEVMDPQHRLFLETSWEALENAGYAPDSFATQQAGWIGVYGGVYNNSYYSHNVITRPDLIKRAGEFQTMTSTEKDYVAMRVSHKLNLKGPSVTVHTACSTSLVAISQAYYALISHQCNLALAGGASVTVPQHSGHIYTEESMLSIDGHTRTFDANAQGTVFSDGVGVVVLKRLEEAERDGDTIYGVIIGAGVNNDGGNKMSFTAPSVEGQASVIAYAQTFAGISPEDISYVEAHGTATPIGDPIEVEALTQAFRIHTDKKQFCALGSVKSNFGHTTIAAGVAGVIKTVLALKHEQIPPSINYNAPNPKIDFANSPFFVNARLAPWPKGNIPRRAGVSSLGVGGTNAHIILEEAPNQSEASPSRPEQLLLLSAKSANALQAMTKNMAEYLKDNPLLHLADVAYTLQTGRKHFAHKRWLLCDTIDAAILNLEHLDPHVSTTSFSETRQTEVVFMLPGIGSEYENMGLSLFQREPVFCNAVNVCAEYFTTYLHQDLRELMYPVSGKIPTSPASDKETLIVQCKLFTLEYALSCLWISWGIKPKSLVGYGVGELVAATLSGVFSLQQACALLASIEQKSEKMVQDIDFSPPQIPFISSLTGTWITSAQAVDPMYWASLFKSPLSSTECIKGVTLQSDGVFLEVGPGMGLTSQIKQIAPNSTAYASLVETAEWTSLLKALGYLWQAGVDINWQGFYAHETRHRIPLPTYPFEKKRVWIERASSIEEPNIQIITNAKTEEVIMGNHKTQALSMLKEVMEDTTGINMGEFDNATTFFEMGMDSLLLTQVVGDLVGKFKVKIMFRQLLEELDTLDKLSDYLDTHLPKEFFPEPAMPSAHVETLSNTEMQEIPTPMVSPVLNTSMNASEDIHHLVSQQIQLMNRQLELLNSSLTPMTKPIGKAVQAERAVEEPQATKSFGAMARVTTTKTEKTLNAAQEEALAGLLASYCKKTALSKKMSQDNRDVLADPRIVSGFRPEIKELVYQIHTIKSSGSHLWDVDGNEYVDTTCGFGTNFFGYVPEFITKAIKEQLDKGMEIGPSHPLAGEVARMICAFTGAERAAFCSTGSEAVLAAMRLARTVTSRKIIVSFTNDYHGLFDEVLVRGNKKLRTTPAAPGIMPSCVENILVLDYGSPESLQIIRERAADIAGILVEPVQSRDPALQPKEYLLEMRKLTEELGICLIFDEVITGFRVARGGCQEYFGILADLGTYGKVIGGGLPMGVVAGKKKWMDALDGGSWQFGDDSAPTVGMTYFAGTYVRHPLALAAAKAVLLYLQNEPTIQTVLANKTTKLVNELNAWCQQVSAPIHFSHFSSMYRLNYTQDLTYGDLLYVYMRERGINIWEHRPCFMTAAHSDKDIELIIKAFKESVMIMQAKEFMPGNPSLVMSEVNTSAQFTTAAPIADARLGRDPNGNPAWYVADPNHPGKFTKIEGKE